MKKNYVDTVRLLLAIAPAVFASGRFAMKGGTALNLFVQEMPRLSVDIDLVFVDHHVERQEALETIAVALSDVRNALSGNSYRTHLPANAEGDDVKLVASVGRHRSWTASWPIYLDTTVLFTKCYSRQPSLLGPRSRTSSWA